MEHVIGQLGRSVNYFLHQDRYLRIFKKSTLWIEK